MLFWGASSFQELNCSDQAGNKHSWYSHGLATQEKMLLTHHLSCTIGESWSSGGVSVDLHPYTLRRSLGWVSNSLSPELQEESAESQGKGFVNRKIKLWRKAVVVQSVSCLISPDSLASLQAISVYVQDQAYINHAGAAALSSREVWLFLPPQTL